MAVDERSLKLDYENALIELQKRFEALRTLSGDDAVDPLAVHRAREGYERARLVWLSCDLRLRSHGIAGRRALRQSKGVLIYSSTANIRQSLDCLLKAYAYVPTTVSTVLELHTAAKRSDFAAVVAYIEPSMRRAPSFLQYMDLVSQPLPLVIFPAVPVDSARDAASKTNRPPATLAALLADLDSAIERPSSPEHAPAVQGLVPVAEPAPTTDSGGPTARSATP
jgi:hypothetical protein